MDARDPFAQMQDAQTRINEIRELCVRWMTVPCLPDNAIPASPDDVMWLCDRVERVLTTMQNAEVTYGIINDGGESVTPMMVERDALAEALGGCELPVRSAAVRSAGAPAA